MNYPLLPVRIHSDNRRRDGITLVDTYCFGGVACPVFLFCNRAPAYLGNQLSFRS